MLKRLKKNVQRHGGKNNQSKQFVGGFARVFQEGFKGMLYYFDSEFDINGEAQ